MQPDISYSIDTIYYLLKKGSVFILFNYLFYFKMINFYYIQLNFRRESERTVTLYSGNIIIVSTLLTITKIMIMIGFPF